MAQVVRNAVWSEVGRRRSDVMYAMGTARYRLTEDDVASAVELTLSSDKRYDVGRSALARRLAHLLLLQMEARAIVTDDRTPWRRRTLAGRHPDREQRLAGTIAEATLFTLLTDADALARAADGILTPGERRTLLSHRPGRSRRTARWTPADVVLLDELRSVLQTEPPVIKHMVIDEAQDLSAMQCRALARRCAGSFTVLGDLAQSTAPAALSDWQGLTHALGIPDAHLEILDRGYRVPRQILDYAARLLPHIAGDVTPPTSVRDLPGSLTITPVDASEVTGLVTAACRQMNSDGGSVAVIAADHVIPDLHAVLRVRSRHWPARHAGRHVCDHLRPGVIRKGTGVRRRRAPRTHGDRPC